MLHFGVRFSSKDVVKGIANIAAVVIAGNDNKKENTLAEGLP